MERPRRRERHAIAVCVPCGHEELCGTSGGCEGEENERGRHMVLRGEAALRRAHRCRLYAHPVWRASYLLSGQEAVGCDEGGGVVRALDTV